MPCEPETARVSRAMFWIGWIVSLLPCGLLLMSAAMKLMQTPEAVNGLKKLGYPDGVGLGLGIAELTCTVLYLIPWTAVLGAVLLTGYLGGATATHLRVEEPYYIPVLVGAALWLGLYLRDRRVRALLPFRKICIAPRTKSSPSETKP